MGINRDIFMLCKSISVEDTRAKTYDNYTKANLKFDGERILAVILEDEVILMNRGGKIVNTNFREVVEDLKSLSPCILDGEIISKDDDFTKLMTRARVQKKELLKQREKEVPITFMAFDILSKDSVDLRCNKLSDRLISLNEVFEGKELSNVEVAEYGEVIPMLDRAVSEDREGIIVKNMNGLYESRRSDYWLKCKLWKECDFKAIKYEENPKGIKVSDERGRSCQISGEQHYEVKDLLDSKGEVIIEIQYLSQSENGNFRFPSYKRIKGEYENKN